MLSQHVKMWAELSEKFLKKDGSSPVHKKEIAIVSIREIPLKPQKW
jgi:hypothetical protein